MTIEEARPIFFGWTRSFWLFIVTGLLMLEQGEPVVRAIVSLIAVGSIPFGIEVNVDEWTLVVMDIAPLITLIATIHQRSGASRPYTTKLNRSTLE